MDFKILGVESAEDVWDKISKVRSTIIEEKMNANMDLFVITMMMVKAKESRLFADGEEIELKKTIKRHADSPETIFDDFKKTFREIKVEGNRKDLNFKENPKENTKEEVHFGKERGRSTTRQNFIDLHQILVFGRKEKEQDQTQERIIDLNLGMVKDFGQNPINLDILDQGHPRWREG